MTSLPVLLNTAIADSHNSRSLEENPMCKPLVPWLMLASILVVGCGTTEDPVPSDLGSAQTPDVATPTFTPTSGDLPDLASPTADTQASSSVEAENQDQVDRTPESMPPCDSIISGLEPEFSMVELAWYSTIVMVGTVESSGEPYFIDSTDGQTIATDYTVVIDTPIRGIVDSTVAVRQFGGQIGECQQLYEGDPAFAIGERVLLFLMAVENGPIGTTRLYPVGQTQGVWLVTDDEMVINEAAHLQAQAQPLTEVIDEIVSALEGTPPGGRLAELFLVPLEESPIVAGGSHDKPE
jgi:hypothetical protein